MSSNKELSDNADMQLVNTHKSAAFLLPLIEAVDINKRTNGVDELHLRELVLEVVSAARSITGNSKVLDGELDQLLLLVLARSLRNTIVLYNNPSLKILSDEIASMFEGNAQVLKKELLVNSEEGVEVSLIGVISQAYMPLFVFHTSLYTSSIINQDELVELNANTSRYITKVMGISAKKLSPSNSFYRHSLLVASEILAANTHDFQSKIIKKKENVDLYIKDPIVFLSKIVQPSQSAMICLNNSVKNLIELMKQSN